MPIAVATEKSSGARIHTNSQLGQSQVIAVTCLPPAGPRSPCGPAGPPVPLGPGFPRLPGAPPSPLSPTTREWSLRHVTHSDLTDKAHLERQAIRLRLLGRSRPSAPVPLDFPNHTFTELR
jgi:hypothetical protein